MASASWHSQKPKPIHNGEEKWQRQGRGFREGNTYACMEFSKNKGEKISIPTKKGVAALLLAPTVVLYRTVLGHPATLGLLIP